jgi:tRNA1Val (adenine37-N6)-methyltransferase
MKLRSETETVDTILGGALTIVQPVCGYRFSIDAILLARFARPRQRDRVLELGAGCGVVSVIIAALTHSREIVAIELQPELAAMAQRNAALNRIETITTICADLRARRIDGVAAASFDYLVANPPYRARHTGRPSPNTSRRIARGDGSASFADFAAATSRYLRHGAKAAFVFTAARTAELIADLKARSLEPKRIRFVHPRQGLAATTTLIEVRKGGGVEAEIEPPLFLYEKSGVYSDAARELLMAPSNRDGCAT